ncbi:RNA polymerase sigma factor [Pseudidiomarina sediminum]|uniref:RNA polymerase sigma factor n=1 Tax=Pseudidiomarina sediminum TaxID=431675 RepID=UPI001C9864BB|nr:sigma-70 family RNA polymerase sigma factor [Pseudidiomarina sediminum]MBY6064105.1 sigma-70 family RNA polymerase sigma factor [Pseudidiomarina sediminum]
MGTNQATLEHVIAEYWPRMVRAAAGYERNPALADELAQEMAFEVWRALAKFEQQSALNTYVYRVIHNVAVDHIRRATRRHETALESEVLDDCGVGPDAALQQTQQKQQLMQAIQRLPLSLRQVTLLRLEDLSDREIAAVLGLTETNVAVRLTRARQHLATLMAE